MIKNRRELIKAYIDFFKNKNHKEIPNSSLIPENDPTVLFTTAGMHPLVPYLLGEKHPLGKRLVNNQKCIRTGDIDLVGDNFHLTFFEMLGNWSLGDYWKKQAIEYSLEFLTKILKIPKEKLTITCFKGDKDAEKDNESAEIWKSLGIKDKQIKFLGKEDNWWGPAGITGPCGPDTEMFLQGMEIWNDVFMQYNKQENGNYQPLKQKNVDTGMGVERTLAILTNKKSVYETEVFLPIIKEIEKLSGKRYGKNEPITRAMRIIADHIKAAVFLFNDSVQPGHKERGYVLKRLIRRAVIYGKKLGLREFTAKIAEAVFGIYPDYFPKDDKREWFVGRDTKTFILDEIDREEGTFNYKLEEGLKRLRNIIVHKNKISPQDAFLLYQSYGFPLELTQEIAKDEGLKINVVEFARDFEKELAKHQELSRTSTLGKFKSGLADSSEKTTKLHTATHLLNQALRVVLKNPNIYQKGSNITAERLRFDFNFDRKLTNEEIKEVENLVNKKISEKLPVIIKEMTLEEAKKSGAIGIFEHKYGEKVTVYSIGNFSREICAGPHVSNTKELGKFKIIKEESIAKGIRRIKAILE
jgi:alanyl-tRNA synthetase